MYENNAHISYYKFLLEKPIPYIRPITLMENIVTNVKFLIISHNKAHNYYTAFLYGTNEEVNWDELLIKKIYSPGVHCSDNFFLENSNLEWFLEHFGLK